MTLEERLEEVMDTEGGGMFVLIEHLVKEVVELKTQLQQLQDKEAEGEVREYIKELEAKISWRSCKDGQPEDNDYWIIYRGETCGDIVYPACRHKGKWYIMKKTGHPGNIMDDECVVAYFPIPELPEKIE